MADDERRRNLGPGGECVCPKCGGRVPHPRGVRCAEERCPNCGGPMLRVGSEHHRLWLDKHGGEQGHKSEGEAGQ